MGATAARQAREILRNAEQVLALELLCAAQGLDFRMARGGPRPGVGVAEAHARVRERIAHLDSDRDLGPDIAAAADLVRGGRLADLAVA
jgi:histidine ammonia-lyase